MDYGGQVRFMEVSRQLVGQNPSTDFDTTARPGPLRPPRGCERAVENALTHPRWRRPPRDRWAVRGSHRQPTDLPKKEMDHPMPGDELLSVAICGLYCRACEVWRSCHDGDDNFTGPSDARSGGRICRGCRSDLLYKHCVRCELRACAVDRGLATCADCGDFPCERIVSFDRDAYTHHDGVVAELEAIRASGPAAWADRQRQRWSCPACGEPYSWYAKKCSHCGAAVPGLDERD